MPSITREQAIKLNSQAPQGWKFDIQYYVIHGEKTLIHNVPLNNGKHLQARIYYREVYVNRYQPTGTNKIVCHTSVWSPTGTDGVFSSNGMGHFQELSATEYPRKNYKDLCKMADTLYENDLLKFHGLM